MVQRLKSIEEGGKKGELYRHQLPDASLEAAATATELRMATDFYI